MSKIEVGDRVLFYNNIVKEEISKEPESFGMFILKQRLKKNISLKNIGDALEVTQTGVIEIESGRMKISSKLALKLEYILKLNRREKKVLRHIIEKELRKGFNDAVIYNTKPNSFYRVNAIYNGMSDGTLKNEKYYSISKTDLLNARTEFAAVYDIWSGEYICLYYKKYFTIPDKKA